VFGLAIAYGVLLTFYDYLICIHIFLDTPRLPELYSYFETQSHDDADVEENPSVVDGKDPVKMVQDTRNPSGPRAPNPQDVNCMKLMSIFGALIAFLEHFFYFADIAICIIN